MPKSLSEYGYGSYEELNQSRKFREDMIELLDPEVDFSLYDGLIVFEPAKTGRMIGVL